MKDILVHVDDSPASEARFGLGLQLARTFSARLSALSLVAEPFMRGVSGHAPAEVIDEHVAMANATADARFPQMAELAKAEGVTFRPLRASGPLDNLPGLLARDGRNSDLVIVGQPHPYKGSRDDELLVEAAFLETGRPALIVPHSQPVRFPLRKIVVGWNASREASRAVHDAMPLLLRAEEVVILIVDPDKLQAVLGRPPGQGVSAHLRHLGVNVRVKTVESGRRRIGETILAEAEAEEGDLLVIGGYGHSKLREALFGGATIKLLAAATTPVMLSH